MRLLHTSDWHLGRRLHGHDLLEAQAGFLTWLLELARAERVAAVLVSGDVFDRAQPGPDAVRLMDRTLAAFARAEVPLVVSSGNHDSAVRLQYAGAVLAGAGIHLRTEVQHVLDPVELMDAAGPVLIYAIPYVLPDAVADEWEVGRSHQAVLAALTDRIRADAAERGVSRVVVMAHAFVTGATACDSEREIRIGGVGDTPAEVFDGFAYVALGHLHGPQDVRLGASRTRVAYSGSPVAFSFSERDHAKSVTLVDLDAAGDASLRRVAAPVLRPLRQVSGRLDDLLALDAPDLARSWVKVVLTDAGRLASPMERLRERWPHTIVLEFAPDRGVPLPAAVRLTEGSDPVQVCTGFVAAVSGEQPSPFQVGVLREAVLGALRSEVAV